MKKHQKNSVRAAALQISLSIALLVLSAILFASSFKAASPSASSAAQPSSVTQPGFYPPIYPNLPQHPPSVSPPDQTTITVSAPTFSMDVSVPISTTFTQPVNTTQITPSLDGDGNCTDSSTCFIGFQADMVFDSAIAAPSPSGSSAQPGGLTVTTNGWTVGSNVLNTGPGTLRTLRVSAFSNDGVTPLNGAGILYNIRWVRVSSTPGQSTTLVWQPSPNDFELIDTDLNVTVPNQLNGLITITGPTATPGQTPTPTVAPTATPTVAPTATPTVAPTATPTAAPTATATAAPTATPTVAPTATATAAPTATATAAPTATATVAPTATATAAPTATATAAPTATATAAPTATATAAPTATATAAPTATATAAPTATATAAPTATATAAPTATATAAPTATATAAPTATPTAPPTATPTPPPTATPTPGPTSTPTPTPSGSCPPITVKPSHLSDGTVGRSYHKNIHASGGSGPYVFTISNGSLPPGLTLATDGDLSGTFTAEGIFTFTILATDQNGCTGKRQYTVEVKCPDIKLKPNHLPDGTVGNPYSKTITASAGTAPYTFTIHSGNLPDGLTLSTGGVLSGTPTAEGTFNFEVVATDAYGCTGKRDYRVDVKCHDITLSPSSLPGGRVNHPYSKTITANGGVGPYTFTIENGNLPDGLHLSTDGIISGTPTDDGTFYFTVEAKDSAGCDGKRQYWIQIKGCPTISVKPTNLPNGKVGTPYNKTITASGGDAPYTFTVTNGHLPAGLNLSTGGVLSGTPTASGGFNFTITGQDAFDCSGKRNYSVTISSH